jgi:hypothetical protein
MIRRTGHGSSRAQAIVGWNQKILGMDLVGDQLRRDVPQVAVIEMEFGIAEPSGRHAVQSGRLKRRLQQRGQHP